MQRVPDMATDLGRPNEDNTEWTFTFKDGLRYEDGADVTAEDMAYAISRSFAIEELPDGPTYQGSFQDGDTYQGPYKDKSPYKGVVVTGKDITIKMSRPFPEMDFYASFPVFTGIPKAKDTKRGVRQPPAGHRSLHVRGLQARLVADPGQEPQLGPRHRPGPHPVGRQVGLRLRPGHREAENTIMGDTGDGQTTITYDDVTPPTYKRVTEHAPDRLVIGTSPCTYMWYLDMTKITDINVRQAIGYAYPYVDAWKAGGEIVGLTRVPGTSILPPGTAGRVDLRRPRDPRGETPTRRSLEQLLDDADAIGYEIKFLYATDDPLSVAGKDQLVKGLEAGGFTATPIASTTERSVRRTDYDSPINVRSSGWCSDWPSGGSWFPAQWDGSLVGLEGMPNLANFKKADADQMQKDILDGKAGDATEAWGEFDKFIEENYYPAVNVGYAGTAVTRGSISAAYSTTTSAACRRSRPCTSPSSTTSDPSVDRSADHTPDGGAARDVTFPARAAPDPHRFCFSGSLQSRRAVPSGSSAPSCTALDGGRGPCGRLGTDP